MLPQPPTLISIEHDDYHAAHIGWTSDGRQFFLTTPFEPAILESPGREYLALFLFSLDGRLLEARIEDFGPRSGMDAGKRHELGQRWLKELGSVTLGRIVVAPFSVERFGTAFGLIPTEMEDEDDVMSVELQPGNFMAFFEPWDSGEYDT